MKSIDPLNSQDFPLPPHNGGASGNSSDNVDNNSAANLIRQKLDSIYSHEPDVVDEAIESVQEPAHNRSKHQKFMAELAASGKPFAQIQTEWHEYYTKLSDKEKHEVWNEFYNAKQHKPETTPKPTVIDAAAGHITPTNINTGNKAANKSSAPQTIAEIKNQLLNKVQSKGKLSKKQHLKSLGFGLAAGSVTVMLLLFSFFNERFIAPFITPSRNVSSTPLISDNLSGSVGKDPKLIIPKINVELPVVYDVETIEESAIQAGLENGVVHYATTSNPGELGNGAIFGHSSNNILNKGKYKFAFVLLSRLESGDTFYIEKDGVRYVYKIFEKKVVPPTDVSVLGDVEGKTSTMALITCDPPGTTINRLVVWGEQISPDPNNNIASTAVKTDNNPGTLAGNPQSLWSRMWSWAF